MTTHVRVTDDTLMEVWLKAAKAKVSALKSEGNLFSKFCHFANDNSLQSDSFSQRTKRMEERMVQDATDNPELAKAIRSTSSSARSVINIALEQGRTVVRSGKAVGKTRLENEAKAVIAGMDADKAMDAKTDALKSGSDDTTGNPAKDAANSDADVVMNLSTNLRAFVAQADEGVLADLAFELVRVDPALTIALEAALKEYNLKAA